MRQVVSLFGKQFVPAGDHVAIVSFSTFSQVLSQLVAIETEEDRDRLLEHVPNGVGGWTCIGCGINAALQVGLKKRRALLQNESDAHERPGP